MKVPFDRARLAQRNALDLATHHAQIAQNSGRSALLETLELSDTVHELAQATGTVRDSHADLDEKARLYVLPLQLAARR
ncbi:MAG TPA: hypothetical protein VI072_09385 [Polyangiaceae bacterium]